MNELEKTEFLNNLEIWQKNQRILAISQMRIVVSYTDKIQTIENRGSTTKSLKIIESLIKSSIALQSLANENFAQSMAIDDILKYMENHEKNIDD
jgi:hypothetical protein